MSKHKSLGVIIADADEKFLQHLSEKIEEEKNLILLGKATNGADLTKLLDDFEPDFLIINCILPVLNGLDIIPIAFKNHKKIRIIAVTDLPDNDQMVEVLHLGCRGYLTKKYFFDEFTEAIHKNLDNILHLCPDTGRLNIQFINQQNMNPLLRDFSPLYDEVELKIISLILEEKTTCQIAEILCLSPRTIDDKRRKINEKLGVKTMVGFTIKTIQLGFLKIYLHLLCLLTFGFPDLFCLEMLNDPSFI